MSDELVLRLREWRAYDLPSVNEIEDVSFAEPWPPETFRAELASERSRGLVALVGEFEEERVVGFSLSWVVVDELHLLVIAVAPEFRRQGIARRLMEEIEWAALGEHLILLDLEVRPSNAAARTMYEDLGFFVVGVRPRYYSNGEDALLMRKMLIDEELGELE